jgi:hypothetical protein
VSVYCTLMTQSSQSSRTALRRCAHGKSDS